MPALNEDSRRVANAIYPEVNEVYTALDSGEKVIVETALLREVLDAYCACAYSKGYFPAGRRDSAVSHLYDSIGVVPQT